MKSFKLNKITAFSCSDPIIHITNENGKTLYYFENTKGIKVEFNLIPSKNNGWFSDNELEKLDRVICYVSPPLQPAKIRRKLKPLVVRVAENPNKCTVDFSNDDYVDMHTDPKLWYDSAIPFLVFIQFHEQGHFKWGNEKPNTKEYFIAESNCDKFACKKMLEKGFNPSQCLFAVELSLSEGESSRWRKDEIFKFLKKVYIK